MRYELTNKEQLKAVSRGKYREDGITDTCMEEVAKAQRKKLLLWSIEFCRDPMHGHCKRVVRHYRCAVCWHGALKEHEEAT